MQEGVLGLERVRRLASECLALKKRVGMRQVVKGLVAGLVEERMLFPRKREVGGSMEGAFVLWDSLLRVLGGVLDGFVDELVDGLVGVVLDAEVDEGKRDAAQEWLLHVLLDEGWAESGVLNDKFGLKLAVMYTCEVRREESRFAEEISHVLRESLDVGTELERQDS